VDEAERLLADYARRESEISPDRYAATNPAHLFIRHAVERALADTLRRGGALPLAGRRILDVGCGSGQWLVDLETFGAERERLAGLDLVPERAARARERLPGAEVREGDAAALPWPDHSFDLVLQSMMFSSILDPEVRRRAAREIDRVLAPAGAVLWYDFFVRSPGNPGVRPVGKRELRALFPGFDVRWRRTTLAPPLVRLLVPRLHPLASALQALRVLDTHAMALLRRPG
jgi:ubiquinone/menaquinone biosynthesis C-methylase UbiE